MSHPELVKSVELTATNSEAPLVNWICGSWSSDPDWQYEW
ncbi:hypothetical protein T06_701 [Trichinella sp. T6]|nr:hypothetical protein T06_9934 [Trichinella sp. T6]KRX44168.1 hypothetical protein T06_701 [Trichinella sp. T6]